MRPIKFRAWLKEKKVMAEYVSHMKHAPDCGVFEISVPFDESGQNTFRKLHSIDEFDLMQFTGLLDKNGKEIFEGDIVENSAKIAWVIEFNIEQGRYRYFRPENSLDEVRRTGFGLTNNQSKVLKVIGNIHENPELINA